MEQILTPSIGRFGHHNSVLQLRSHCDFAATERAFQRTKSMTERSTLTAGEISGSKPVDTSNRSDTGGDSAYDPPLCVYHI